MTATPTAEEETRLFNAGATTIAGVDEVGRGAWAGPVSVGVAVLTVASLEKLPRGVRDSKLLSCSRREELFDPLGDAVLAFAVGHASPQECDVLGMTRAQRLATDRAFSELSCPIDAVILDGRTNFSARQDATVIVGADRLCISVAAASVLAKVTRDRIMIAMAAEFPPYAFERNKGYPSPEHRAALEQFGLTAVHRMSWSFAPTYGGPGQAALFFGDSTR